MSNSKVGKNRKKTGGRKKGTPNKRTLDFVEALGAFNPVGALIEIYNNCDDWGVKLGAIKEMLKYTYPQRKAIEPQADKESMPEVNIYGLKI